MMVSNCRQCVSVLALIREFVDDHVFNHDSLLLVTLWHIVMVTITVSSDELYHFYDACQPVTQWRPVGSSVSQHQPPTPSAKVHRCSTECAYDCLAESQLEYHDSRSVGPTCVFDTLIISQYWVPFGRPFRKKKAVLVCWVPFRGAQNPIRAALRPPFWTWWFAVSTCPPRNGKRILQAARRKFEVWSWTDPVACQGHKVEPKSAATSPSKIWQCATSWYLTIVKH